MTRPDNELPFFFGHGGELFGIYHPVARPASRAVLLCAPLGQDYMRCHRIYRQLAGALASQGMPVLRFDYYGCGDSAGQSEEVDWQRCQADAVTAARELRSRSGTDQVLAFGARLGGSIALSAMPGAAFDEVVVWDPVIDGATYAATQDAQQDAMRLDSKRFIHPRQSSQAAGQWLGFPVSPTLRAQVAALRPASQATPSLLIDSLPPPSPNWQALFGADMPIQSLPSATPWDDLAHLEVAIISHPLVQTVTSRWREGVYA